MSHPKNIDIVLVGAGGYGEWYLRPLLAEVGARGFRLVGVVDPRPESCSRLAQLRALAIPFFASLEAFYASGARADLAILATPIHLHCRQTVLALGQGSHVLCEKPLCASLEEIDLMRAAEKVSGKTVTIGYQWSFSPAIQRLKADILSGRLGRPRRFRTLVCWPRDEVYYRRNRWAGRQRTEAGEPVFDSPVSNAAAHYLHNMLYLLGDGVAASAEPERVEAELWRANAIENYDTAALRIGVKGGVEILFYASHAVEEGNGPLFSYEFERGTVAYEAEGKRMVAILDGGEEIDYGSPDGEPHAKLEHAIESARTGRAPLCGIAAASAHAACVALAQGRERDGGIRDFLPSAIRETASEEGRLRYVAGLMEAMGEAYGQGSLFSETGSPLFEAAACAAS